MAYALYLLTYGTAKRIRARDRYLAGNCSNVALAGLGRAYGGVRPGQSAQ